MSRRCFQKLVYEMLLITFASETNTPLTIKSSLLFEFLCRVVVPRSQPHDYMRAIPSVKSHKKRIFRLCCTEENAFNWSLVPPSSMRCSAISVLLTKCGPKRFLLTKCGPCIVCRNFIRSSAMFTYP